MEITVGSVYRFKHSSGLIDVKVLRIYNPTFGGIHKRTVTRYQLLNLKTNREIVAKSKTKFMFQIN